MDLRKAARRVLVALAIGFVVFVASAFGVAYALSHRLAGPSAEPVPPELARVVVPMRLRTVDGLTLGAWYSEGAASGASIVLAHGNGASRSRLAETMLEFRASGHSTLAVTMRAHGDSEGDENDVGFHASRDVAAAVARMRSLRPGAPILVYGESMGAAAALFASHRLGDGVAGYVLVAPYAELDAAVERRVARYLPPGLSHLAFAGLRMVAPIVLPDLDRIRPVDAARGVPRSVPVLVLVGTDDDRAPPSDAEAIRARVRRGCVVRFPGLSHESLRRGDVARWRASVLPFVASAAAGAEPIAGCVR